jgi:formate/nitrite transporter FocA (FNT family)
LAPASVLKDRAAAGRSRWIPMATEIKTKKREKASKLETDDDKVAALHEHLVEHEIEETADHSRLRVPQIYEIVRHEGETEMARPAVSLWWSGVAAGLSISFSVFAKAVLHQYLPDASWRPLLAGFGYTFGFLLVVLARQQLFTENTITAVLPVVAQPTGKNLYRLLRLWSIVFAANLTGTLVAALFSTFAPVPIPGIRETIIELSRDIVSHGFVGSVFIGIPAGFLIAAMVWLMPSAENARFHVVTIVTYIIAIGGFSHIVVGSFEAFMLLINGDIGVGTMLTQFTIPVLIGNVVGGTALFALLSYAQVMKEV